MHESAEFRSPVRETLMKRAGQRCSFPLCSITTSGPTVEPNSVANIGRAAHIFSAREGGPRGTGGLTRKERQSAENGIWLCSVHADLIDKNNRQDFPAGLLRRYKEIHEERIRRERDGISQRIGWIHSLRCVTGPPWFKPENDVIFGKITIIHGGNGSGKTVLCNWLEGLSKEENFLQWFNDDPSRALRLEFQYLDPVPKTLRIRVVSSTQIEHFVDGNPVPFSPNIFRIIRIKEDRGLRYRKLSDLAYLSAVLGISSSVIQNTLKLVGTQSNTAVPSLRLEKDQHGKEFIWAVVNGTHPGLSLQQQLSDSERLRVLVEISSIFARYSAICVPTVLIFNGNCLGSEMRRIVEFLSHDKRPFQTVIESVEPRPELGSLVSHVRLQDVPSAFVRGLLDFG